jgi:hypothetical protein
MAIGAVRGEGDNYVGLDPANLLYDSADRIRWICLIQLGVSKSEQAHLADSQFAGRGAQLGFA